MLTILAPLLMARFLHVKFPFIIIGPLITISSVLVGTVPPTQELVEFQLPPPEVEVMVAENEKIVIKNRLSVKDIFFMVQSSIPFN